LFWAPGVQQNVTEAELVGWSKCWTGTYNGYESLASVLGAYDKPKLLMACRPVGAASFTLAAMGPRDDVLFDCGDALNCTKQSNGVGFYFSTAYSWGFAPAGEAVYRAACDYNDGSQTFPDLRACWHTFGGMIDMGYRCGNNELNASSSWERVLIHAD
jgi:hypothetical protein